MEVHQLIRNLNLKFSMWVCIQLRITYFSCLRSLIVRKTQHFASFLSLIIDAEGLLHQSGCKHHATRIECGFLTVGAAAHGGALDHFASLVHTPAVAGGVPALQGLVAALLVTLGGVGTDLGKSRL